MPDNPGSIISHKTEAARLLYVFGDAEGRRVVNVAELSRLTGATERTIHAHIGSWRREVIERAEKREDNAFRLSLSSETLQMHSKDICNLRALADRLHLQLADLPADSELFKSVHSAYLATRRDWERASGVSGALAAAEARLKESERAKAKAQAAAEASERERENQPRDVSPVSSVFRRRGPDPDGLD